MTPTAVSPADPVALPQRALPPLTRLDDYEIETLLAQSELAIVYRGFDHALQRPVAIKEYLPDAFAQRGAAARVVLRSRGSSERFEIGRDAFIAEVQTLASCEHPALLRVQRLLRANGTVYRIMPLVAGVSLLEHCAALGAAPEPAQLRAWLDTLLGALAVLHDAGFVHGAISPDNILLQPDGVPLLLDFNAVRRALLRDGTSGLLPPPAFEPIEQRAGDAQATGPRTDLYSLAASLLACANADLPAPQAGHAGASFIAHWQRCHDHLTMPVDVARMFGALDACLAAQPAQRPQSVAALRALIERGVPARPVPAPAAPLAQPGRAEVSAADGARVIAELDQTFAAIAAQAQHATPQAAATPRSPPPPLPEPLAFAPVDAPPPLAPPQRAWSVARFAAVTAALLLAGAATWWWLGQPQQAAAPLVADTASPAQPSVALPVAPPQAGLADGAVAPSPQVLLDGEPPPNAGPIEPPAAAPPAPITPAAPSDPAGADKPAAKPPAKAEAPPPRHKAAPAKPAATSPSEVCGPRTQFSLYRCMHAQCAKAQWHDHAQCQQLRRADALE